MGGGRAHAHYNCVQAGGRVQLAGGKVGSGGGIGVTGTTTERGGTPTQKIKTRFFLWRMEPGGVMYRTPKACTGIYSDSGDFPCKAAVLTWKPGGGGRGWGAPARAENMSRTTRPASQASRCGHGWRLHHSRTHSRTKSSSNSVFFVKYLKHICVFLTYKNRYKHLKWCNHALPCTVFPAILFSWL